MRTALIDGLGLETWSTVVPVSLARTQPFQPNPPHYYSSACCAEHECTVYVPLRCLQFENKGRQTDRQTDTHTDGQTDRPSTVTLAHARRGLMKSTKVQTLGAYCISCVESCVLCQCACAEIGLASRCSCSAWCCQFSLQHGLSASVGIVFGKAECG